MQLGLREKVVVVTGGASNIGRGVALGFAAEGVHLTIADLDEDQAHKVATLAKERGAASADVAKVDVTDFNAVRAMFDNVVSRHGRLDALVNGVGWDRFMYFTQTTPDLWQRLIQVNFVGVLNCTKCALAVMVPQNGGAIVSIGSDASRSGEPREAVYGGMKAAINAFTKTIAKENGRYGIRCNVVCPGVTIPSAGEEMGQGSMWASSDAFFSPEQLEKVAKALPLRKLGTPEDVANAIVFLASDAAGHITGQILSVSGGYSMVG